LPARMAYRYARLEPYGMWIVLGLLYLTPLTQWIGMLVSQFLR